MDLFYLGLGLGGMAQWESLQYRISTGPMVSHKKVLLGKLLIASLLDFSSLEEDMSNVN